jgi:hypothetical protein
MCVHPQARIRETSECEEIAQMELDKNDNYIGIKMYSVTLLTEFGS